MSVSDLSRHNKRSEDTQRSKFKVLQSMHKDSMQGMLQYTFEDTLSVEDTGYLASYLECGFKRNLIFHLSLILYLTKVKKSSLNVKDVSLKFWIVRT